MAQDSLHILNSSWFFKWLNVSFFLKTQDDLFKSIQSLLHGGSLIFHDGYLVLQSNNLIFLEYNFILQSANLDILSRIFGHLHNDFSIRRFDTLL